MSLADQRQKSKAKRVTFTPLRNGRYRCNWNGTVIAHGAVHAARNRRWSELHPHIEMPSPVQTQPLKTVYIGPPPAKMQSNEATINDRGYVQCPNMRFGSICDVYKYVGVNYPGGQQICDSCRQSFTAVPAKPTKIAILEAEAMNAYGDVDCPHCGRLNEYAGAPDKVVEHTCNTCRKPFLAKPRFSTARA